MIFKRKKKVGKEFKRQLRLAITAAIGFSVAFAWRNTIWNLGQGFVAAISNSSNRNLSDFWASLAITFFAVITLAVTSRLLKDN